MKLSLKRAEIQEILARKTDLKTQAFFLKSKRNALSEGRVAFVIAKRWGNSVWRNRVRRRVRDVIQRACAAGHGRDIVCIVHRPLKRLSGRNWLDERQRIKSWCEGV